ncbi:uncharacterized protein LOC131023028 [Salvia miltiorrhiza]|uniref:uncharacterized protein LOC131023028 n=1 Tax=Salvia miltiorrhiza TaxID=226208 RepID=UPI0025AC61C2|nr:uncharacterized protein LOC131023028 [Salvia miltiorrhiza]
MAEHRNCARHVYMNWKKQHKATSLKNIFWSIVKSTYVQEYNMKLEELKKENVAAYDDFISRDVKRFYNNIAETFNGYIIAARGMHIIHMCEQIMRDLMVRQVEKLKLMAMVSDRVCPGIIKGLEKTKSKSVEAYVFSNMNKKYEVSFRGRAFVVDVNARSCTCREWDVTGIPCLHACAAIQFEGEEPSAYVHGYYTVERYLEAYKYAIESLVSGEMWLEANGFVVKPPAIRKLPGRPKKVRRRDLEEDPKNPHKLKRFGLVMTCRNCQQKGHNSKTCKNEKAPPKPKGKRGRPRIHPIQPPRPKKSKDQQLEATSRQQEQTRQTRQRRGFVIPRRTVWQENVSYSQSNVTRALEGPSIQESRNPAGN